MSNQEVSEHEFTQITKAVTDRLKSDGDFYFNPLVFAITKTPNGDSSYEINIKLLLTPKKTD